MADGPGAIGFAFLAIQHDQVDIGRDIEFAAAQFAHADNDHLLWPAGGGLARHAMQRGQVLHDAAVGLFHGQVGQRGHRSRDFLKARVSMDVAHHRHEKRPASQLAKHGTALRQFERRRLRRHACKFQKPVGKPFGRQGERRGVNQPGAEIRHAHQLTLKCT